MAKVKNVHRTQKELKPKYDKAMALLKADPDLSHAHVAREVGLDQGQVSRLVRLSGDATLIKKAQSRLRGGRTGKKGSKKSNQEKKAAKKPKQIEFSQLSVTGVGGGKTLLVITDDQSTIATIMERFQ